MKFTELFLSHNETATLECDASVMKPAQELKFIVSEKRRALGLSQKSFAKATGICNSVVSRIESGVRQPNAKQLESICRVLKCEERLLVAACIEMTCPEFQKLQSKFTVAWRLKPQRDRDSIVRYWAARKRYPDTMTSLERSLNTRPDAQKIAVYLRDACFDSGLEYLAHLMLLKEGAIPGWASPERSGFDLYPVVDPVTRRLRGSIQRPALALGNSMFFPQVNLLTTSGVVRPDLLWLKRERNLSIKIIEFDGVGHNTRTDSYREVALGLPVLRFSESEILTGRFFSHSNQWENAA